MADIQYGYHATMLSCLADISRLGLIPNDGTRGVWPDALPVVGFVFFCDDVDGARYYQEQLATSEPSFVLRFARPRESRRDPHGDMMGERTTDMAVAASTIDIEIDGAWMPLVGLDASTLSQ